MQRGETPTARDRTLTAFGDSKAQPLDSPSQTHFVERGGAQILERSVQVPHQTADGLGQSLA